MTKKYNHIAVFIKGHVSTWNYTKQFIFKVYEQLADEIDWYFATWDPPSIEENTIKNDFYGKQLVAFVSNPKNVRFYNTGVGANYLSYSLLPAKNIRERFVTYDAVFDQRTDTIPFQTRDVFTLSPATHYASWYDLYNDEEYHLCDLSCMADSTTFDIICRRCLYPPDTLRKSSNTWTSEILVTYAKLHNLNVSGDSVINQFICTPYTMDLNLNIGEILSADRPGLMWPKPPDNCKTPRSPWLSLSLDERLHLSTKYNINYNDYIEQPMLYY